MAEVQKEQAPKEVACIGLEGSLAKSYQDLSMNLKEGEWIEHFFEANGNQGGAIKKDVSTLSKEEMTIHEKEIAAQRMKELLGLHDLKCFKRMPRHLSHNRVYTRWVMTWKTIDGKKGVKCRLTMRGFKDRTTDLETFAGTASRCGQRVVNTIAAQEDTFELWSFDVSQAFAKGLTFGELAELTDTPLRDRKSVV